MPRLHVLQINVTDMDLAIDFYCDKLGFAIRSRDYHPEIVVLADPAVPIVLFKVETLVRLEVADSGPFSIVIDMQAASLQGAIDDLRAKGVDVLHETPQDSDVGKYASIRDPFGNVLHIVRVREEA